LEDGAEVYRILSADVIDPSQEVKVEANLRYSILFGDPESVAASRSDLLICRDTISNIIEQFAPEF
jgi:hypothetical protein